MRHKKNAVERDRGYVFEIVKANIIALIVALIAILVSALIVKIFTVSDGAIPIIFMWLSFVVFSALDNNFVFGLSLLNDSVLGAVAGMISGIIAVNIRKH